MMSSFEPTIPDTAVSDFQPDVPGRFSPDAPKPAPAEESAAEIAARRESAAFEAGRQEGLVQVEGRCAPAIGALTKAALELDAQRNDYLHAQRRSIVDLAIEIASHLMGETIEAQPERIVDQIESALRLTDASSETRVELNPDDHSLVAEAGATSTLSENVRLIANPDLRRGETIVSSGRSTIDARHAVMLDFVRDALAGLDAVAETPEETAP